MNKVKIVKRALATMFAVPATTIVVVGMLWVSFWTILSVLFPPYESMFDSAAGAGVKISAKTFDLNTAVQDWSER